MSFQPTQILFKRRRKVSNNVTEINPKWVNNATAAVALHIRTAIEYLHIPGCNSERFMLKTVRKADTIDRIPVIAPSQSVQIYSPREPLKEAALRFYC